MLNQKKVYFFVVILAISMIGLLITGCGSNSTNTTKNGGVPKASSTTTSSSALPNQAVSNNTTTTSSELGQDTDQDGLPDTVEKTLGTNVLNADTDGDGQQDKVDKDPTYTTSLIQETSTVTAPIKVVDARVEDNVNAADHLEITVTNTGKLELQNFDVYYTINDKVNSAKEGYYLKLTGFILSPGVTQTLHFDNKKGTNHFGGNVNGLYGTSKNGLDFQVNLHSQGFAPVLITVKKAKGTAEVAD
ncbi:MAG: hypothetical protein WA118_01795 [Carboxydocellales bacterium]